MAADKATFTEVIAVHHSRSNFPTRTDISGVWQIESPPPGEIERLFGDSSIAVVPGFSKYFLNILANFKPDETPIRPEAAALTRKHAESQIDATTRCLPTGFPRAELLTVPFKIIQTPRFLEMLYEVYLAAMIKHIRAAAVLFAFALVLAAQSPAQNWNNVKALSVGTSVRISVGSRTVTGQVQRVTDDSLVVDSGKGQEMFTPQEVMRVSTKTKSHRLRNTLLGLGIGTGAGIGIGVGVGLANDCSSGFLCGLNTAAGGAVGGAIGLVGGTVIGAVIPTGSWREVYKR